MSTPTDRPDRPGRRDGPDAAPPADALVSAWRDAATRVDAGRGPAPSVRANVLAAARAVAGQRAAADGLPDGPGPDGTEVRAHAADGRLLAIALLAPGGRCSPRKVLARKEAA